MDLTAKELIELTKEIDQKCIDFADWLVEKELYIPLVYARVKSIDLLVIYKKEKSI